MAAGSTAESLLTLRAALANLSFFTRFRKFCEEYHNHENLLFWSGCEEVFAGQADPDGEETDGSAVLEQDKAPAGGRSEDDERPIIERVVARFVRSGAPLEVNMEEGTRKELSEAVRKGDMVVTRSRLRALRRKALQEMLNDILPRFNRTYYWKDMEHQAGITGLDAAGSPAGAATGGAADAEDGSGEKPGGGGAGGGVSSSPSVGSSRAPTASHGRRMSALARFSELPVGAGAGGAISSGAGAGLVVPEAVRGAWRDEGSAGTRRATSGSAGAGSGRVPMNAAALLDEDLVADAAGFLSRKTMMLGMFSQREALGEEEAARVEEARNAVLSAPAHEGYATKRGNHHKSWKKRWFVLSGVPASACALPAKEALDGALAMDPHEAELAGLDASHHGAGGSGAGSAEDLPPWGDGKVANPEFGSAGAGVVLGYFEDERAASLKGLIHLKDVVAIRARAEEAASATDDPGLCIELQLESRSQFMQTQSRNEHERWMRGIVAGWGLSTEAARKLAAGAT